VLGFGSRDATVYTVDDMVDDMVDSMMERRYRGARPRRSAPDDPPERDGTATSRRACRDGNGLVPCLPSSERIQIRKVAGPSD